MRTPDIALPAAVATTLWSRIVDDAAMFSPGHASPAEAVTLHGEYRLGAQAERIGPLVVPEAALGRVEQAAGAAGVGPLEVSVVAGAGAGSLTALADRMITQPFEELVVVSVEIALRDLDDLPASARRILAAAGELPRGIAVYVELPDAPRWEAAAEQVEAAGLFGKLRTGGREPSDFPTPERLAERLSVLVEADLAFKLSSGLHEALPTTTRIGHGTARQHGLATVLAAIHALVAGEPVSVAAELLRGEDEEGVLALVAGLDVDQAAALRRRFRSFGCCGVLDPIADLLRLGLL